MLYTKILVLSLLFISSLSAQAPDTMWTKLFGGILDDAGYSVEQTIDDGFIITGRKRHSPSGDYDVYLIKTNQNGDTLWTRTYGGAASDRGNYVQQTADSGYIITGTTTSFGNGSSDIYLLKTDKNGNLQWSKTYGDFLQDFGNCVKQTNDNGYIITGGYQPAGNNFPFLWLIKTDSNGDSLWSRTYGGNSRDAGTSVVQSDDDGFVIAGYTYSFGAGGKDAWVIKTNANGDSLWSKTFGNSGEDEFNSIQKTMDEGFIITGRIVPQGSSIADVLLVKINSDGDTLWTKTFGGTNLDIGLSVYPTMDRGFIVCGKTYSTGHGSTDLYIIKTDENGSEMWTKTIGSYGDDEACSIQQTTDGGFILAGIYVPQGTIYSDIILVKISPEVTDVNEQNNLFKDFKLFQNYPNPFNPSTKIRFTIPNVTLSGALPTGRQVEGSRVQLKIYDILGNEVATLVDEYKTAGSYEVNFNTSSLSSGVYLFTLRSGSFVQTKKMILVR